jgi:hypothetical protein
MKFVFTFSPLNTQQEEILWREQVNFRCEDDQHDLLHFYSANSLKQQSVGIAHGHIIIDSEPTSL